MKHLQDLIDQIVILIAMGVPGAFGVWALFALISYIAESIA